MKKFFVLSLALASTLALSACDAAVGVIYGGDGHWHHRPPPPPPHHWGPRDIVQDPIQEQSQRLAADGQIKYTSAFKIVSVVESPNPQQAVQSLNLDPQDLSALGNLQMPSASGIHQVAATLGESDEAISTILQRYINDMQTDAGVQ